MNTIISIILLLVGFYAIYYTYKDKKNHSGFNSAYIFHIRGYIAGVIFISIGVLRLFGFLN
jgi:uncharacterized membrane protein